MITRNLTRIFSIILFFFISIFLLFIDISNRSIVSFIAFGDTGTGNSIQYKLSNIVRESCQNDCLGIFLLGDVIYPDGIKDINDKQIKDKFELPFSRINKKFYIALGNHDFTGCTGCMIDYAKTSNKWIFPSRYYKETFGNTEIFVIDTNNFSEEQDRWLKNVISKSVARWKIVVAHHPITSYDLRHIQKENPYKKEIEQIICGKVDLYISGHDHGLMDVGDRCGVRNLISGGGSAPLGSYPKNLPDTFPEYGFVKITTSNLFVRTDFINIERKNIHSWVKYKI